VEVDDVVDEDVAVRGEPQRADVVGEARLTGEGGGEAEPGVRREVVDDLQHRGTFVAGALLAREYVDGGR
jgi:hypothetical protein